VEHVFGGAEVARVAASPGAPQPLAVQQVRAGEIDGCLAVSDLGYRFEVGCFGLAALVEQRLAAGAESPFRGQSFPVR
jgi:hypothetical protein